MKIANTIAEPSSIKDVGQKKDQLEVKFELERCSDGRIDGLESDGSLIVTVDAIADPSPINAK